MAMNLPHDAEYDPVHDELVASLPHAEHGYGEDRYIPDTSFEEWCQGVEALLRDQGFFDATQRLQRLRSRHGWSWLIDASET